MKLCALVFFCLLVPSETVTDSCLHKTVVVMVLNGSGLSGDGFDDPEPYVVVNLVFFLQITIESKLRFADCIFFKHTELLLVVIFVVNL